MEVLQMQAFVHLAQTLHMSVTAQEMNTTSSHISKLISSLEAELGVKLFDRVGRRLLLNEHGRLFYDYVDKALQLMNSGQMAVSSFRNKVLGTINIGCYAFTPILYPYIVDFARENPQVNFHLAELKLPDIQLFTNTTDLILTTTRGKSDNYLMDKYFPFWQELKKENYYGVISSQLLPLPSGATSIRLAELSQFPLIENAPSPFYDNQVFQSKDAFSLSGDPIDSLHTRYTTNDFYTKVLLIDEGLGFGLFPEICIPSVLRIAPGLQILSLSDFQQQRCVILAHKDFSQMSAAARSFWDFFIQKQKK